MGEHAMSNNQAGRFFVLVHGAGHGGWAWRRLADLLSAKGHRVFTPTLTGLGERSHLMSGAISLQTHILDVVNLFRWEDLRNAVLVGHSYAGWVVSGAVEQLDDRVDALVYLDAFLPDDGQRGFDFLNDQQQAAFREAQARGEVSRPGPTSAALKIQRPEDAAWVDSKITPHPIGVSLDALELTGARADRHAALRPHATVPTTALRCRPRALPDGSGLAHGGAARLRPRPDDRPTGRRLQSAGRPRDAHCARYVGRGPDVGRGARKTEAELR
jgi:pimeloyl-ACP methyl ester carboxylesterase